MDEKNNGMEFATRAIGKVEDEMKTEAYRVLMHVRDALEEKGYNPVNQIVGYILSGDPTYITGHNSARILMTKLERDRLLEEVITFYLKNNR